MRSVTQEHSAAPPTTRDLEQPAADAPASTPVIWDDEETDALLEHRRIDASSARSRASSSRTLPGSSKRRPKCRNSGIGPTCPPGDVT
jgi:hypothetical protein